MPLSALLVVAQLLLLAHAATDRIIEKTLDISALLSENAVPVVDPPHRSAGYFKLRRTYEARMFYFYFESRSDPANDPVVLWMTGGPGCSSELAVFYENGPFKINPDLTLSETTYGWDVSHNMIFVDQPINTGFSFTTDDRDDVYDETGVADDMVDFLEAFFELHPEVAKNGLYITGESYAGHYVPAVTTGIWWANKNATSRGLPKPYNLKGLAIGNGLTNPTIQSAAYADFAYENNLIANWLLGAMHFFHPICAQFMQWSTSQNWDWLWRVSVSVCMAIDFQPILAVNSGINVYDITKECEGQTCYDFSLLERFLSQQRVMHALHVNRTWQACNMGVYFDMQGDWMRNYDVLLPQLLADNIQVLIYAGERDLICNWLGNSRWVNALVWPGQPGFVHTSTANFTVNRTAAGLVVEYQPLTFLKVYKAGHMVPMDQPMASLDMISRFTRGKSLVGEGKQPPTTFGAPTPVDESSLMSDVAAGLQRWAGDVRHIISSPFKRAAQVFYSQRRA